MTGSTRERNQLGKECFSNEFLLSLPLSKGELLRLVQTMDPGETVSNPGGTRSVISSSPLSLISQSPYSSSAFGSSSPPSLSFSSTSSPPSSSVAEGVDKKVGESPRQRRGKRLKGSTSPSPHQSDSKRRRRQGKGEERIKPPQHQAEESLRTATTTTMTLFERERQQHNALRKRRGLRQRRTSLTANEFDWVLGPEERRYLGRATQK